MIKDFSQNSLKRKRYKVLRDRIKARFPGNVRGECVYLRRGQTGTPRIIQNEDQILDFLIKRNFLVVDVASDSLDNIVKALMNAKIVVTMEGSHISHCIYACPENSGLAGCLR